MRVVLSLVVTVVALSIGAGAQACDYKGGIVQSRPGDGPNEAVRGVIVLKAEDGKSMALSGRQLFAYPGEYIELNADCKPLWRKAPPQSVQAQS